MNWFAWYNVAFAILIVLTGVGIAELLRRRLCAVYAEMSSQYSDAYYGAMTASMSILHLRNPSKISSAERRGRMRFDDVWMQPWQIGVLSDLAFRARNVGAAIEIGTHQGLSAIPIANTIYPKMLHVVDHWEGSTDFRDYMRIRDNYSIFVENVAEGTQGNIGVHKQDWRDFAKDWIEPIGFLHLDAEHTTTEVSDQISMFLPYMCKGSVLAGDDYNWPGVRAGVALNFKEVRVMRDKLWWVTF